MKNFYVEPLQRQLSRNFILVHQGAWHSLALKQPWRHHEDLTVPDGLYLAITSMSPSAPLQKGNNNFINLLIIQEAVGTWTQAPWVSEHPSSLDSVVQMRCQRQGRKQNSISFFKKTGKVGFPMSYCVFLVLLESELAFLCWFYFASSYYNWKSWKGWRKSVEKELINTWLYF